MEIHPDSVDFVWQSPEPPFGYLSEAQVASFDELGYCKVDGAFSEAEIAEVTAVLDPLEVESAEYLREHHDGAFGISQADGIVFNPHAVAREPVARAFACHDAFLGVVRDLIGADVRLYWDQLVYKNGGTGQEFPWHQDNGYTFVVPQQYVTCWVALTAATLDNGCPWVLPGGHRRGTLAHRWAEYGFECVKDPEGAVPVELAAGSMVVFSSLTPHRTGPNLTDDVRKAYILQYAPFGAVMKARGQPPVNADNPDWQFPVLVDGHPV